MNVTTRLALKTKKCRKMNVSDKKDTGSEKNKPTKSITEKLLLKMTQTFASGSQDTIFLYAKSEGRYIFYQQYIDYSDEYKERFKYKDARGFYRKTLLKTYSEDTEKRLKKENRWIEPVKLGAYPSYKQYLHESKGKQIEDIWVDVNAANPMAGERVDYPTQKPEALLERIIKASSNEGDLIADFFCGSGTTAAVAEKLGRKWICSDLGKFAIHTTRKRMIGCSGSLRKTARTTAPLKS